MAWSFPVLFPVASIRLYFRRVAWGTFHSYTTSKTFSRYCIYIILYSFRNLTPTGICSTLRSWKIYKIKSQFLYARSKDITVGIRSQLSIQRLLLQLSRKKCKQRIVLLSSPLLQHFVNIIWVANALSTVMRPQHRALQLTPGSERQDLFFVCNKHKLI